MLCTREARTLLSISSYSLAATSERLCLVANEYISNFTLDSISLPHHSIFSLYHFHTFLYTPSALNPKP